MLDDSGIPPPPPEPEPEEPNPEPKRRKLTDSEFQRALKLKHFNCPACKHCLLDPNLKIYKGPPPDALEEEIALTDERLRLYNEDETMPDADSLPQNKITQFAVFDSEGHLCHFDGGLIEGDQRLYFSGYVKPIYNEDPSAEDGIPVQELGPIVQWFISGYDEGDNFLIIFQTPYGEYVLMEPSEDYAEFMRSPRQKALLSKIVVEFLSTSDEPVYEELLSRLQQVTVPEGIDPFDDNTLSKHAQFLVDQVGEIDDDGDMLATHAMQTIIDLHGVYVKKFKKKKKGSEEKNLNLSEATMTPFVSKIFGEFFDNSKVYFSYSKKRCQKVWPVSPNVKKLCKVVWEEGEKSAQVNDERISGGDFVYVQATGEKRHRIFKVEYFFHRNFTKQVHCTEFCRGVDTILEEASNPSEFFMLDVCSDWPICKIIRKIDVILLRNPEKLAETQSGDVFFVQKKYLPNHGSFEDLPPEKSESCVVCDKKIADEKRDSAVFAKDSVTRGGEVYAPGCCVLVEPYAITFDAQKTNTEIEKTVMTVKADEVFYPEIYRKAKEVSIVDECPEPYKIAYVKKITTRSVKSQKKIFLTVNKFYRPENTTVIDKSDERHFDFQLLFWSEEEAEIDFENVKGKVEVRFSKNPPEFGSSPAFYFHESYDASKKSFEEAREVFLAEEVKKKEESVVRKLRTLNPFSGCGGLAEGLTQSGVADIKWGIDIDEPTAKSFQLNFPRAHVFHTDCNFFLRDLLAGEFRENYPKKGDVEMLIGGPPCQGFSTMNLFTTRQYSRFKNSLIVTYLSFCDYYRPKYFLLENVKNFICFKKSVLLKHVLGCLVAMGYQCTFGILQAGNYGLPQTRRRFFVIAAAPGEPLPKFPNPTNVFYGQLSHYEYEIVGKKFVPNFSGSVYHLAPYRVITIRDALRDLPEIKGKCSVMETAYRRFLLSTGVPIKDHVPKEVSPLNEARIRSIPSAKNCDWRDLPNVKVLLRDGTVTQHLQYTHHDAKNGKSKCGMLRGVCSCASGKPCDPSCKQHNTLIPWCLTHTANRNNNWAGLYGRLDWDGVFNTTITNPEPSCKQGRVLHPQENRVVSIRECARSQGLPDYFRLSGTVMEKYRQVGNAVPSPVARALGYELKKCLN